MIVRSLGCACAVVLSCAYAAFADGLSRSPNFLVLGPTQETTDTVLLQAEQCRQRLALQWLGKGLPDGAGRTLVWITTAGAGPSGQFWPLDSSDRKLHSISIAAPPGAPLDETLAHEVTHLVMELSFAGSLPAWANEGVAMFADGQRRQDARTGWIKRYAHSGNWPELRRVLEAKRIRDDIEAYAVADYLTKYLLTLNDASTFFAFAVQGNRVGWENAARQHYGLPLGQLQTDWQSWAARTVTGTQLAVFRRSHRSSSNH